MIADLLLSSNKRRCNLFANTITAFNEIQFIKNKRILDSILNKNISFNYLLLHIKSNNIL